MRVDLVVEGAASRARRVARWFRVERVGLYWESIGPVDAAEILHPGNVQLRYGAVSVYPRLMAIDWPENIRSTRRIGVGAVITPDDVEQIPLVKVGDAVELQVAAGTILRSWHSRQRHSLTPPQEALRAWRWNTTEYIPMEFSSIKTLPFLSSAFARSCR